MVPAHDENRRGAGLTSFFGYFETASSINPVPLIKFEYALEKHVKLNFLPQGLKRCKQRAKNGLVGERPA